MLVLCGANLYWVLWDQFTFYQCFTGSFRTALFNQYPSFKHFPSQSSNSWPSKRNLQNLSQQKRSARTEFSWCKILRPHWGELPKLVYISNSPCIVFPHVPPSVRGRLEGAGGYGHTETVTEWKQPPLPCLEWEDKHDEDGFGIKWLQRIQTLAIQVLTIMSDLSIPLSRISTRLHHHTLCGLTSVLCGTLVSTTS